MAVQPRFHRIIAIACMALAGLSVNPAQAALLFSDSFQGTLAQWTTVGSGVIVTDPLNGGNSVLSFTSLRSGGDIFSPSISAPAGTYRLSFDVLGTCGASGCGAAIGVDAPNEQWLADDSGSAPTQITQTGQWLHVDLAFTSFSSSFVLKAEDWLGVAGPAGDVYFDNICVYSGTDSSGCPSMSQVAEPSSLALVGLALLGASTARRRRG